MNFDLAVLWLVAFFGLWGLFTGAARQLARMVGLVAAYGAATPFGQWLAPAIAHSLSTTLTVGTVLGVVGVFIVVYACVQLILTAVLRRFFDGGEKSQRRGLNRLLGGLLGALKAALILYIGLCAASFLENNISLAGRRLGFTPKDSQVMKYVKTYNVLETHQFGGASDLLKTLKLLSTLTTQKKVINPDAAALLDDPRIRALMASPEFKKALATSNVRALIANDTAVEVLRDDTAMRRVEHVADIAVVE